MSMETYLPPNRQLSIKTKAKLTKNNLAGDNFGGWLVSQMHLAGKNVAALKINGCVETVAINNLIFHEMIRPNDEVCCYTEVIRKSRECLTLHIEAWIQRSLQETATKATEGIFIFAPVVKDNELLALKKSSSL